VTVLPGALMPPGDLRHELANVESGRRTSLRAGIEVHRHRPADGLIHVPRALMICRASARTGTSSSRFTENVAGVCPRSARNGHTRGRSGVFSAATTGKERWAGTGLNRRHQDFQAWARGRGSARNA
jgi:hypothetical protein